jgi:hypothetical protein
VFCRPKSDLSCLPEAKVFRSSKDRMAAYRSLEAIKEYFPSIMMEETIHSGSDRRRVKMVAEGCHKVLALLVISHLHNRGADLYRLFWIIKVYYS